MAFNAAGAPDGVYPLPISGTILSNPTGGRVCGPSAGNPPCTGDVSGAVIVGNPPLTTPTPPPPASATLQVGQANVVPGQRRVEVPLLLDNPVAVRAIELRITDVPDSVSLHADQCAVTGRASGMSCVANQIGTEIRIVLLGISGGIVPGSGPIASIFVDFGPSTCDAAPTTQLRLSNTALADGAGASPPHTRVDGSLTCLCRGDIQQTGTTDVFDALLCVDFVVGRQLPTPQQAALADMRCDGRIDVVDCLRIVDVVIGRLPACPPCP